MPATLIVLAHPEPKSFNGTWAAKSREALEDQGHTVFWSDLVSMGFDPVERPEHYPSNSVPFDPLKAQDSPSMPANIADEVAKIEAADQIILHFPIWWFGPPAILKGWMDRVLLHGRLHSVEERFDTGKFKGRRALFCVTTGATAAECGPDGKEGNLEMLLWPLAQTLRYLGFTVLKPIAAHSVHGYHEGSDKTRVEAELAEVLATHANRLSNLDHRETIAFNAESDFDGDGRLKRDAPSLTPFIRHFDP